MTIPTTYTHEVQTAVTHAALAFKALGVRQQRALVDCRCPGVKVLGMPYPREVREALQLLGYLQPGPAWELTMPGAFVRWAGTRTRETSP
jgi:hypothetical protein